MGKVTIPKDNFFTPEGLANLCARIAKEKARSSESVYDPVMGNGELLVQFLNLFRGNNETRRHNVCGLDVSNSAVDIACSRVDSALSELRRINKNPFGITIAKRNFFSMILAKAEEYFDIILMDPPWNEAQYGLTKTEFYLGDPRAKFLRSYSHTVKGPWTYVLGALFELKEKGTLVALLPPSALSSDDHADVRKHLAEQRRVSTVIRLADGLYPGTSHAPHIVVIGPRRDESRVRMINASQEYLPLYHRPRLITYTDTCYITYMMRSKDTRKGLAKDVSYTEIERQGFRLDPDAYIMSKDTTDVGRKPVVDGPMDKGLSISI